MIKKNFWTDVIIPDVIYSKDNEGIIIVDSKYTDVAKRVALYQWIEGNDFDQNETLERFFLVGQVVAKLHCATKSVEIPENLSPKRWDKVFYYRGEEAVYEDEKYQHIINSQYHDIMDHIIPYLSERLSGYYESGNPQLIHADINPWNIKIYKDEIRLFDFEEAMYGFPIHDFAIILYYYRYNTNFDYTKVKKFLFDGYSTICQLPQFSEYDLELLMTARRINFLNYVLTIEKNPEEYVRRNIQRVKDFMSCYM